MAEDNVIINEGAEDLINESAEELHGVARKVWKIANNMKDTIQVAIQHGYEFAVKTLLGVRGEVTIEKNAKNNNWSKAKTGGVAFTIKFPKEIGDYDMIIFSPKTAKDRAEINYAELFVSPDVNDSQVCISCAREPRVTITLVYFIIRGGTAIPDSSTSENQGDTSDTGNQDNQSGTPDAGNQGDGSDGFVGDFVEVPIEEED